MLARGIPAGPTKDFNCLSDFIWPERDHRTRYLRFSFATFAHCDLFDGIRKIIRVVMTIGVQQDLKRHSEIASCLPRICAPVSVANQSRTYL